MTLNEVRCNQVKGKHIETFPQILNSTLVLKLLFPVTALSNDSSVEFPGNLPASNLIILRTRVAFDRCGRIATHSISVSRTDSKVGTTLRSSGFALEVKGFKRL